MEKLDSGCILLKNSEYKELLEKEKKIKVSVTYNHYQQYGNFTVSGDFQLGSDLFNQLSKLSNRFTKQLKSEADLIYNNGKAEGNIIGKDYMKEAFAKLPWYKRLFFDEELSY